MYKEEIIYSKVKDNLRKYGRKLNKSENEKIIYECAVAIYGMRQDYTEDTRIYNIGQSIYDNERKKILTLQDLIQINEESCIEAKKACKDGLVYIDIVIKPRVRLYV